MHLAYMICAIVGGTIMVVQLALMILGFDNDTGSGDFELDEAGIGGSEFFEYLSLKSCIAFLTFFGLTGLTLQSMKWNPFLGAHVIASLGAGLVALYIVGFIMQALRRLHSQGNLDLRNAVGEVATVYLRVPPQNGGTGKVTVQIQNRTVEATAITYGEELSTGSKVHVVGIVGADTLEVAAG